MTTWFTADTHFGHRNVIDHARRPFSNVEEMNETMIDRWNAVVGRTDEVWHLGDFALGIKADEIASIFDRLNGRKHLVRGNHDPKQVERLDWVSVHDLRTVKVHGERFVLCHYPMLTWDRAHHGSIHLHGHSHGTIKQASLRFDVGVDCWDYTPVHSGQIADFAIEIKASYEPVDHHRPDN